MRGWLEPNPATPARSAVDLSLTWSGRCPGCSEWNTLVEAGPGGGRGGRGPGRPGAAGTAPSPVLLADVETSGAARLETGIGELDRVLGGGLVPGSLVLLGGSPGIGKSTLTGMALANLAASGAKTLYVSGEESNRPGAPPGRATRRSGAARPGAGRDLARAGPGGTRGGTPDRLRDRLDPDHCTAPR